MSYQGGGVQAWNEAMQRAAGDPSAWIREQLPGDQQRDPPAWPPEQLPDPGGFIAWG